MLSINKILVFCALHFLLLACAVFSPSSSEKEKAHQYFQAGLGLFESEQYPQSLSSFKEAWRILPQNVAYQMHYALALDAVGKNQEALKLLEETCSTQNEYPECHNNLSVFYLKSKRYQEALDAASQALSIPTYTSPEVALRNQGLSFYFLTRHSEAQRSFRDSLKTGSITHMCVTRMYLSRSLLSTAQFKEALHEARLARNMCDSHSEIQFWLIYTLFKTAYINEAHAQLSELRDYARSPEIRERAQKMLSQLNREEPLEEPSIIL